MREVREALIELPVLTKTDILGKLEADWHEQDFAELLAHIPAMRALYPISEELLSHIRRIPHPHDRQLPGVN